ncbi:PIR Superfamily Protein [Plasmodium ovale curtisi]|uniref:PIR Superfamily Protein n=1 Tax=Plasmodium ovale curtisi TaxID=864141 RepID=A0A1A8XAZ1_PLAOA|nr:PIR Superfamily Protein [Plasmodium ovale curtisi]
MDVTETNICELPSEKYYNDFGKVKITDKFKRFCDSNESLHSGENLLVKYPELKDFCYKLSSNLECLKEKNENLELNKRCTYLNLWLQDYVINTIESKSAIICIAFLQSVWSNVINSLDDSIKNSCAIKWPQVSIDYRVKWKKIYDYNKNFKTVECTFQNKEYCNKECKENCGESCKENYCKYILDIFNLHNEFAHVCNETNNQRCPDFWNEFHENYSSTSHIVSKCKDIYDKLGFYKVKMPLDIEGEKKYVEQYESTYIFSFFEKLIGYSIKYYLSKTMHYSRYIVLPIILILLFYFFMKKLSFFGSKIAPKADDMRKMWRNVQGVTNPATLLNPMKPPGGGNKIGLPYMPK